MVLSVADMLILRVKIICVCYIFDLLVCMTLLLEYIISWSFHGFFPPPRSEGEGLYLREALIVLPLSVNGFVKLSCASTAKAF